MKRPPERASAFRAIITKRMAKRNLTAYAVAKLSDGRISQTHVRNFLSGKKSLSIERLVVVLSVCGLVLLCDDPAEP